MALRQSQLVTVVQIHKNILDPASGGLTNPCSAPLETFLHLLLAGCTSYAPGGQALRPDDPTTVRPSGPTTQQSSRRRAGRTDDPTAVSSSGPKVRRSDNCQAIRPEGPTTEQPSSRQVRKPDDPKIVSDFSCLSSGTVFCSEKACLMEFSPRFFKNC